MMQSCPAVFKHASSMKLDSCVVAGLAPLNTSSYLCTLIGLLREKIGAVSLHPSLNFLVANYVPRLSFSLRLAWKGDPYSET